MRVISRSSYEDLNRCPRRYYYRYLFNSTGVEGVSTPWELIYGLSLHVGLETLIRDGDPDKAVAVAEEQFIARAGDAIEREKFEADQLKLLLSGHIFGWWRVCADHFFSTYEVLSLEQEERTMLSPNVVLASRCDAVVREFSTGHVYVYNWKSTISKYDWNSKWHWDIQAWSEALAIANRLKEPVVGCIFEGFYKGSKSKGFYRTPLLWGYRKKVGDNWIYSANSERGNGWEKFSTKDVSAPWGEGIKAWVAWMPLDVLSDQFLQTTPVLRSDTVVENWLRQVVRRENDIDYVLTLSEEADRLDFFYQNFNHKNCQYCPFNKVCGGTTTIEAMLADGLLKPREDHHAQVEGAPIQEFGEGPDD